MSRFAIILALGMVSSAVAATESAAPDYYQQSRTLIDALTARSLDPNVPMKERLQAARQLKSDYPEASRDLWDRWLASDEDLAQIAVQDMSARLFGLHYSHADHAPSDSTPIPIVARDKLRSLMKDDARPPIQLAALNALCQIGDEAALEKLGEEVVAGRYQSTLAMRHLSAKPEVGAPILAKLAADTRVASELRESAVNTMVADTAYKPYLRELAFNAAAPSASRLAALKNLSADGETGDAALFLLAEKDPKVKGEALNILATQIRTVELQPGQLEILKTIKKVDASQPRGVGLDAQSRKSLDALIQQLGKNDR